MKKEITAYKLVSKRKNGTYGSLFINKRFVIPIGKWLKSESYPTKGFAYRPGWHTTSEPAAPHLSMKNRVWIKVKIKNYDIIKRPESQGGVWFLAKDIKFMGEINDGRIK